LLGDRRILRGLVPALDQGRIPVSKGRRRDPSGWQAGCPAGRLDGPLRLVPRTISLTSWRSIPDPVGSMPLLPDVARVTISIEAISRLPLKLRVLVSSSLGLGAFTMKRHARGATRRRVGPVRANLMCPTL
jgi:hypothetical protein